MSTETSQVEYLVHALLKYWAEQGKKFDGVNEVWETLDIDPTLAEQSITSLREDGYVEFDGDLLPYNIVIKKPLAVPHDDACIAVPNIADDELDPFEYSLYVHYLRDEQQPRPPSTLRQISERLKMSVGRVKGTRGSLVKKGYIEVSANGMVKTIDQMPRMIAKYGKKGE